jgi:putative phage-type endonuclease
MPFTQAQLEERRQFLGASEAAASVGLSEFFTPYQLYLDKIGMGTPLVETLPIKVGVALEPLNVELFEAESGLTVTDRQLAVVDKRHAWRRATLDGRASDGWLVEAKSSGVWQNWGREEDAVPAGVIYQCQHQMACCLDAPGVYVPVILAQRQHRIYKVVRDAKLIDLLTVGEEEFMERVKLRTPPEPVNMDDIKIRYPESSGFKVTATPDIEALAYRLAKTKDSRKQLEKVEKDECFGIAQFMKDADELVDSRGMPLFTHRSHIERRLDVTALREQHPDIADMFSPEKPQRRLLCKFDLE